MIVKKGIGASPGVAIASAVIFDTEDVEVPLRRIDPEQSKTEIQRLTEAVEVSKKQLQDTCHQAAELLGRDTAAIFDFHMALIQDKELRTKFDEYITTNHVTAEYAVQAVLRAYGREFLTMPDSYLADRVKDVFDIEKRLLRNLIGQHQESLSSLASRKEP